MNVGILAIVSIVALAVCGVVSQVRRPYGRLGAIALCALAASLAGPAREGVDAGFIMDPWRGSILAAAAIVAGATMWLDPDHDHFIGLEAAAVAGVAISGQIAVALGFLLVGSLVGVIRAITTRPHTLHAGVPEQLSAMATVVSDVAILFGVLIAGNVSLISPAEFSGLGAWVISAGILLRLAMAAVRSADSKTRHGGPILLALPALIFITWIDGSSSARSLVALVGAGLAAYAGWRCARGGESSGASGALIICAAVAVTSPSAEVAAVAVPLLLAAVTVSTVAVAAPSLVPVASALPLGAAFLPVALLATAFAEDFDRAEAPFVAVGVATAGVLMSLGAFAGVRDRVSAVSQTGRVPLVIAVAGTALLVGVVPVAVLEGVGARAALTFSDAQDFPMNAGVLADMIVWLIPVALFGLLFIARREGTFISWPEPATSIDYEDPTPLGTHVERFLFASSALLALLVLLVFARSASNGWL